LRKSLKLLLFFSKTSVTYSSNSSKKQYLRQYWLEKPLVIIPEEKYFTLYLQNFLILQTVMELKITQIFLKQPM
jgi:ribosomal protein L16 Arg81 hydroxylase